MSCRDVHLLSMVEVIRFDWPSCAGNPVVSIGSYSKRAGLLVFKVYKLDYDWFSGIVEHFRISRHAPYAHQKPSSGGHPRHETWQGSDLGDCALGERKTPSERANHIVPRWPRTHRDPKRGSYLAHYTRNLSQTGRFGFFQRSGRRIDRCQQPGSRSRCSRGIAVSERQKSITGLALVRRVTPRLRRAVRLLTN